jgi:hypothetical protein
MHRLPLREPLALLVAQQPNQVWSADFMREARYCGMRFGTP